MLTKLNIAVAIAAMACCTNLNAQDCGCGGSAMGYGGGYGYAPVQTGGYGCGGMNNCGREISQGSAAALWVTTAARPVLPEVVAGCSAV